MTNNSDDRTRWILTLRACELMPPEIADVTGTDIGTVVDTLTAYGYGPPGKLGAWTIRQTARAEFNIGDDVPGAVVPLAKLSAAIAGKL